MKTRGWLPLSGPLFLLLAACSAGVPEPGEASRALAPVDEAAVVGPEEEAAPETPAAPACEVDSPRTSPLELFVMPEAGIAPFSDAIARAERTIDVMVYQMGYGAILEGLEAKARAGVKVRVILDLAQQDVNLKYMNRLRDAGATVIWSDPRFVFMHAKVIVVDGKEAILSTGNYSQSYMLKERNLVVRNTDPADLAVLGKIFEADFTQSEPDLSCTRLLVAPVNARQRLLAFIGSAKRTILVHSMQLGDKEVREALAAKKREGVDVRAVLADPSWIDANASAAAFLAESGIPARHRKHLHVKSILVDDAAYVGSINLSWNSITKNREIGLIVTEPGNVDAERATFEKDWAEGTPF
jgi:phosphatidylserine/phosphatidylglycerophosphate/cardiolipin synthase-like enzyme